MVGAFYRNVEQGHHRVADVFVDKGSVAYQCVRSQAQELIDYRVGGRCPAPHCVQQLGLRGLRRIPRHRKKTAVKPTSGMPQTAQLAASGGVFVSKGAFIAMHPISFSPPCAR
jgi:hypothetical protein